MAKKSKQQKPKTVAELKKNPKLYEEFLRQKQKFGVTFKNFLSHL
jgi:hypothetical protein